MINLLSATLLSEFLDDQVIDFLIELDDMIPLVLVVHVAEADLGILRTYFDFNSIFVCQKLKFLQCTLEMLNFSENEC